MHVIFSPHLDDAVSSCGGSMAKFRAAGAQVRVITVFQKQPNLDEIPPRMRVYADYNTRYEENKNALQLLDVQHQGLDFYERAFVKPYLKSLPAVFFAPRGGSKEYLDFNRLIAAIKQVIEAFPDKQDRFYFPLGIGNHYDHARLFFAAILVMEETKRQESFMFYEDAYAMMGNAPRKKHSIVKRQLFDKDHDPSKITLKTNLTGILLAMSMKDKPVMPELDAISSRYAWTVHREDISAFFDKKLAALFMYKSQIKALMGNEQLATRLFKRYHAFWNQSEPYWRAGMKQ